MSRVIAPHHSKFGQEKLIAGEIGPSGFLKEQIPYRHGQL